MNLPMNNKPMKMKLLITLSAVIGLCAFAAEDQDAPVKMERPQLDLVAGGRLPPELIKIFDKDGDGKLSDEEATAIGDAMKAQMAEREAAMLKEYDANHDGELSETEMKTAREAQQKEFMEKFDKDKDGKLSDEEFIASLQGLGVSAQSGRPPGGRPGDPPPADNVENPAAKPGSAEAIASDRDPFWDDKSPECQFLAGAWEGYVAGLTASADRDTDYKTTVVRSFHRMQRGVSANVRAYENTKQEYSDTDEHKALFLQVEKVARLVDQAFVKRFSKPTKLATYERWLGMEWGDNVEPLAADRGKTYRLEVESVISEETIVVTRFVISAPRSARIELVRNGGRSTTTMEPAPNSADGSASARLTVFAAVSHTGGDWETHLFKIETTEGAVGGPGSGTIHRDKRLKDLLSLTVKPGEYKMGVPLELGVFEGGLVTLLVK